MRTTRLAQRIARLVRRLEHDANELNTISNLLHNLKLPTSGSQRNIADIQAALWMDNACHLRTVGICTRTMWQATEEIIARTPGTITQRAS